MKPNRQFSWRGTLRIRPAAPPRCQSGFSLIEILLVMAIFAIGILAIMTLHVAAINSNARARVILMGSTLLADQFEKLISADDPSAGLAPEEAAAHAENGLVVERTITATPIPHIKRIDLTVTLDACSGRSYSVIYYKRNPG